MARRRGPRVHAGPWSCACQSFVQEQAKRVDIRPAIDGHGHHLGLADRLQRQPLFRGQVLDGAAHAIGSLGPSLDRLMSQVKIQQHGLGIRGQQHVGGLQVQMDQAMFVRIVQRVGQAGPHPAHGLNVGSAAKELPVRAHGRDGNLPGLGLVQGIENVLARPLSHRLVFEDLQHPGQAGAAEIRHAQQPQVAGGIILNGVERDNVRVLQVRQRQVFLTVAASELEDHGTVGEGRLQCQEDATDRAPADLGQKAEIAQRLARFREARQGPVQLQQRWQSSTTSSCSRQCGKRSRTWSWGEGRPSSCRRQISS